MLNSQCSIIIRGGKRASSSGCLTDLGEAGRASVALSAEDSVASFKHMGNELGDSNMVARVLRKSMDFVDPGRVPGYRLPGDGAFFVATLPVFPTADGHAEAGFF